MGESFSFGEALDSLGDYVLSDLFGIELSAQEWEDYWKSDPFFLSHRCDYWQDREGCWYLSVWVSHIEVDSKSKRERTVRRKYPMLTSSRGVKRYAIVADGEGKSKPVGFFASWAANPLKDDPPMPDLTDAISLIDSRCHKDSGHVA